LDEVFVRINGKLCYLWRAVDHEGEVLEAVVTAKRDKAVALKLLKRIMKKFGRPHTIVTDRLRAYSAAMKDIGVAAERHEVGGRLNNRAENSHQPFRRRERAMQRFRSLKTLQKLSSVHAQVRSGIWSPADIQAETLGRIGGVARPCSVDPLLREGVSRYASTNRRYFDNTRPSLPRRCPGRGKWSYRRRWNDVGIGEAVDGRVHDGSPIFIAVRRQIRAPASQTQPQRRSRSNVEDFVTHNLWSAPALYELGL
jgi:IS1 family transposase